MMLQVGDQVRWRHAFRESTAKNALGTITAVIPNETGVDDFTLYDIQFDFGTFTLYAAQIEQEPERTPTDGVRPSEGLQPSTQLSVRHATCEHMNTVHSHSVCTTSAREPDN